MGVGVGGRGEERFREGGREGAARDGDLEGVVSGEGGALAVQDVGTEVGGEGRDVRVGVEVGGFGHGCWWVV